MKYVLVILMLALAGCFNSQPEKVSNNPTVQRPYELKFVEDKERGVTCYFIFTDSLSCIKTKPSAKEEMENKMIQEIFKGE